LVTKTLICKHCGKKSTYEISIPKPKVKRVRVTCLNSKCGYSWVYQGTLKRRIECPRCRSTKNAVNRKVFGSWNKENLDTKARRIADSVKKKF